MITIYKYPLAVTDKQTIKLPKHSKILSIQAKPNTFDYKDGLQLWAMVNTDFIDKDDEEIEIFIFETGEEIKNPFLVYISTVQLSGSLLVFHVFQGHTVNKVLR